MKKILLLFIGIIFSFLIGCKDDDKGIEWSDEPIRLSGQVFGMNENEVKTRFRGGAGVGIYIADTDDVEVGNLLNARVRNKKFMQSADGLVGDPLVYWKENSSVEIAAYYPYLQESGNILNACFFQIAEHQGVSVNGLSAYEESDFLWARGSANFKTESILLDFKHLMSKVIIYLKSDAMVPGDMVESEVSILGMATGAKIDLETGVLVAEGAPVAVVATEEDVQKDDFEIVVKAIVVPQTVEKGTTWLNIKTLGGYSYIYELSEDLAFQSGKQLTVYVSVESGECHVTIGEIEDWTEKGDIVVGEAMEDLPVFELYDFYNLNGVQGLVIAIDETGKHGTLISLDETLTQWCTDPSLMAAAYSADDAQENLNEILDVDPTLEKFPAMKWCMNRNKDGVSGWYMPALNELRSFWNLLYEETDLINDKITATGVMNAEIIKTDYWDTNGYFSSTLSMADRVRSMNFSLYGSVGVTLLAQDALGHVRAFYKF